ncbi:hypothetical protein ACLKA7_009983 [Drosophila subpalustris]
MPQKSLIASASASLCPTGWGNFTTAFAGVAGDEHQKRLMATTGSEYAIAIALELSGRMRAVAVPGLCPMGGAESAILRTWPDNDDNGSGLSNDNNDDDVDDDDDDDDSEGNVHWPQAE